MVYFELTEDGDSGQVRLNSHSLSGGERNRLLLRRDGNYVDASLVSGVDFREDGRSFTLFDAYNDGWLDMGFASPNYPRFRILRNVLSESECDGNGSVEILLEGGQLTAEPSKEWSPRDPYGARVIATTGDQKRIFQLSCGSGLSTVNAKRIHIGMGDSSLIEKIEIQWPSGKKSLRENIKPGTRLEVCERD